jgi:hypothetical protein
MGKETISLNNLVMTTGHRFACLLILLTPIKAFSHTNENLLFEALVAFAGSGGENLGFHTNVPKSFPTFEIPPGFTLIGALQSKIMTQIAFTSPDQTGLEKLTSSFREQGWVTHDPMGRGPMFKEISTVGLCHPKFGLLSLRGLMYDKIHLVKIAQLEMGKLISACIPSSETASRHLHSRAELPPHYPSLEIPTAAKYLGGGFSRVNYEVGLTMEVDLQVNLAIEPLLIHFGSEMTSLGWSSINAGADDFTGSSSWNIVTPDNKNWLGTITVFSRSNDKYRVSLTVVDR